MEFDKPLNSYLLFKSNFQECIVSPLPETKHPQQCIHWPLQVCICLLSKQQLSQLKL